MAKKQCITTFVLVFALLIVFSAAAVGLNFVTGPIIEKNNAARASGALAKVFPNGKGFEEVDLTTLQDVADVTTFSTGTEPNRRVVVSYSKYSHN